MDSTERKLDAASGGSRAISPRTLNRIAELLSMRKKPFAVENGAVWFVNNSAIIPFGPAKLDYSLSRESCERLFARLDGRFIKWTDGFVPADKGEWYAVICDRFTNLEEMKSKHRCEVRRGLKNCEVRQVDAEFVGRHGHEVYVEAAKSYTNRFFSLPSEEEFRARVARNKPFEDIMEYWAVFAGDKLIALAENYVFDKIEAEYSSIKLHPAYLSLYPSYALIHRMNEAYLTGGFEYVNDGWRVSLHETEIQDFLIRKFGFRKAYTNLKLRYRPLLGLAVRLTYPFRRVLEKLDDRLKALYLLEECSRTEVRRPSGGGRL